MAVENISPRISILFSTVAVQMLFGSLLRGHEDSGHTTVGPQPLVFTVILTLDLEISH